jgi:hypothetical protein
MGSTISHGQRVRQPTVTVNWARAWDPLLNWMSFGEITAIERAVGENVILHLAVIADAPSCVRGGDDRHPVLSDEHGSIDELLIGVRFTKYIQTILMDDLGSYNVRVSIFLGEQTGILSGLEVEVTNPVSSPQRECLAAVRWVRTSQAVRQR